MTSCLFTMQVRPILRPRNTSQYSKYPNCVPLHRFAASGISWNISIGVNSVISLLFIVSMCDFGKCPGLAGDPAGALLNLALKR